MRFPSLSPVAITAKLDTGARTSALHAFRLKHVKKDGEDWLTFEVHPLQRSRRSASKAEARLVDERVITSSNGERETRPVIHTDLKIGTAFWPIELTLTRRDSMSYRLLLGRTALRGRVLVDPTRSFTIDNP